MAEYLRPSTLFRKSKFAEYYDLRDVPVVEKGGAHATNAKPDYDNHGFD